ncbi:DUF1850 domain-containing protein [Oceanobacillus sp. J11TS1]|uniref:DUF1850 domain-containing protein n=1 Tax=Oceanobacillus sp. J11TS1 TaxID=2807191 RepID=UPI001B1FAB44|nr:DUF1850 domain-containing protein [Oceanobacillus sp. J11TS1]GIO24408.1 hypothetical protein J11TS1_29890 [Oceanobacillus sp. J11TS1]
MQTKGIKFLIVLVLVGGVIGISVNYPIQTALVFNDGESGKLTAFLPLNENDYFSITFTHSIHLTDVVEKYRVTEDLKIEQYEIVYEEFGIGMPSNAGEGEEFIYDDGKYHIRNMKHQFESLNIRNGEVVSNHRLAWHDTTTVKECCEVPFNDYFVPGDWYKVSVENITLLDYWKGERISE